MLPHERSLVKRLSGQSFALLGINVDQDRKKLEGFIGEQGINWRFWCDGSEGPIVKQWRVRSYPTIYVLDPKGIIRFKNVRDKALEAAVAELLAEGNRPKE